MISCLRKNQFGSKSILLFATFLLFAIFSAKTAVAATVPAPTITDVTGDRPLVTGQSAINAEVLIYFDGSFAGLAKTQNISSSSANFSYQASITMPAGRHTAMAIARDKTSLVLSAPSAEYVFNIGVVPAPTLVAPNEKTITAKVKPLMTGLTLNNTRVYFYIDGVLNGKTDFLSHKSGTANFAYKPFLNLSRGQHTFYAVAENKHGNKSLASAIMTFKIELPMPAPTMYQPVVNPQTSLNKPFIVGLAKNDSKIRVFIDKKPVGEFMVKNHNSGTADFAFRPVQALTKGQHLVYTTAIDKRGKESSWSNLIFFTVKEPQIAQGIKEENSQATSKIETSQPSEKDIVSISPDQGKVEPEKTETDETKQTPTQDEELKQIVAEGIATTSAQSGTINETEQNQGKLKLNLIIFIIFLLAVIGWIIWVNRELIKERQAGQNQQAAVSGQALEDKDKNEPPPANTLNI